MFLLVILNDRIVGDDGFLGTDGGLPVPKERSLEDVVPSEGSVSVDDDGSNVRDEEERSQESTSATGTESDSGDPVRRFLAETEFGRSLVDDGQTTDGTGDEEPEGSRVDGPRDGVSSNVDGDPDEREDDRAETSGGEGSHTETGEDGAESFPVVPSPLDLFGSDGSDTDTGDGRDQRVSRGDVCRVSSTPHDPGGSSSESTSESQHLYAGVALESTGGDDTVLDGIGGTRSYKDGTKDFKDGTQDHGLSVRDRTGRDTSRPCVGDIVCRKRG